MYRPSYSANDNQDLALKLIQEFPLGLVMSINNQKIESNYLPFFVSRENSQTILSGHFAKSNPHWKSLKGSVAVSFQGPNKYISPTIYVGKENVPTWSYAVVQVHGTVELIQDQKGITNLLNESVAKYEKQNGTNWKYDLPLALQQILQTMIVGIKITVTDIDAKFELNQNRNREDYEALLKYLKNSTKEKDIEIYRWMTKEMKLR